MLKLKSALFLIRMLVNAVYSWANFQWLNNMVSLWSFPLGKIFSGKLSLFPATFRLRRLQYSCWRLFAQSQTAVSCPVHKTVLTGLKQAATVALNSTNLRFTSSAFCISRGDISMNWEEVLSTVTFGTSCVIYHGKRHFLLLVWGRQRKCRWSNL